MIDPSARPYRDSLPTMSRKHQFPAMPAWRLAQIRAFVDTLAATGFIETRPFDELLAHVQRLEAMASIPPPVEVRLAMRFGGAIGTDHTHGCFVCGAEQDGASNNISAHVINGLAEGFHAESWFGGFGARLDHRHYEPQWLQLKIGACGDHRPHLQRLMEALGAAAGTLTPAMIAMAKAPVTA